MPIEAAVKRGMHLARTAHVVLVVNRVIRFVRILFLNALQRQRSEVRGLRLREGKLIDCSRVGLNLKRYEKKRKSYQSCGVSISHYRF